MQLFLQARVKGHAGRHRPPQMSVLMSALRYRQCQPQPALHGWGDRQCAIGISTLRPNPSGWIYHPVCKSYGGQSETFLRRGSVVQEQTGVDYVRRDLLRPCLNTRSAPTPWRICIKTGRWPVSHTVVCSNPSMYPGLARLK